MHTIAPSSALLILLLPAKWLGCKHIKQAQIQLNSGDFASFRDTFGRLEMGMVFQTSITVVSARRWPSV
jgi:hypothetical protein